MRINVLLACSVTLMLGRALMAQPVERIDLRQGWHLNSTAMTKEDSAGISNAAFDPKGWYAASDPTTVLNALTKQGV